MNFTRGTLERGSTGDRMRTIYDVFSVTILWTYRVVARLAVWIKREPARHVVWRIFKSIRLCNDFKTRSKRSVRKQRNEKERDSPTLHNALMKRATRVDNNSCRLLTNMAKFTSIFRRTLVYSVRRGWMILKMWNKGLERVVYTML